MLLSSRQLGLQGVNRNVTSSKSVPAAVPGPQVLPFAPPVARPLLGASATNARSLLDKKHSASKMSRLESQVSAEDSICNLGECP